MLCVSLQYENSHIHNPDGYTAIKHKDGNKKNNKVEKLEWKPIRRGVV